MQGSHLDIICNLLLIHLLFLTFYAVFLIFIFTVFALLIIPKFFISSVSFAPNARTVISASGITRFASTILFSVFLAKLNGFVKAHLNTHLTGNITLILSFKNGLSSVLNLSPCSVKII